MPKIAASLVYTGSSSFLRNSVVELDTGGEIISVGAGEDRFREKAGVEFYAGILVPGLADIMCGDRENHWLQGRGIRVCGRIGLQSGPAPAKWKSPYGGTVECRVFRHMDHFMEYFTPDELNGVYHAIRLEGNPPVLAGRGRVELVELMFELQQGPGSFSLPMLLEMATGNGARALGFPGTGSLLPGTRPGVNIIEGVDIPAMRLLPESRIRRLY